MTKFFTQINVVCHPHEEDGIYRTIFSKAKRVRVQYRGSDYATISPISKNKDGLFAGVLALWTEVDQSSDVLKLSDLEEINFTESGVTIPENIGFNSRLFQFIFRERDHQLFIERTNEKEQTLSPNVAAKALSKVLNLVVEKTKNVKEVHVTVVPNKDAIEEILSIYAIKKIHYIIVRPNNDYSRPGFTRVYEKMQDAKLARIEKTLTREKGAKSINVIEEYKEEMEVAAENGIVEATGKDASGNPVKKSTKDYPKDLYLEETDTSTTLAMLKTLAKADG